MSLLDIRMTLVLSATLALAACGGNVVVQPGSGGAGGGTTTTMTSSTSSGGSKCNGACPQGFVCLWGSDQCVQTCNPEGVTPCGAGLVCDGCATSSCPDCDDCVGACLPAQNGQCDAHDDCAPGSVCLFGAGKCAPECSMEAPSCPSPDLVCNPCATSSCPVCADCRGACTESF
ncbi:MAG: hypothetical protein QM820_16755 [Minicystis sp.]